MASRQEWFSPSGLAYTRIKEAILNLEYLPGERLSEAGLGAELELGRSPIRTALVRLQEEGWVRIQPQSGTFVCTPSSEQVEEMVELRLVLEMHAARQAAQRVGAAELAELRVSFEGLAASGVEGNFADFLAFDDKFHATIHRAAGNRKILEMIRNLRDQIRWVRSSNAVLPGRVGESVREMQRVLEALEQRDGEAAAAAMGMHISNIAQSFRASRPGAEEAAA